MAFGLTVILQEMADLKIYFAKNDAICRDGLSGGRVKIKPVKQSKLV